jgi:DNA mismatch repair protein MutS
VQIDLFATPPVAEHVEVSALESWVAALNPDDLNAREALEALYELKKLVKSTTRNSELQTS